MLLCITVVKVKCCFMNTTISYTIFMIAIQLFFSSPAHIRIKNIFLDFFWR